ncbi:MAG: RNA chaperone Hfq [Acidobacteria bacterium]|nr:RNA chaperone Hfq [Acidobacteriota bacterium]
MRTPMPPRPPFFHRRFETAPREPERESREADYLHHLAQAKTPVVVHLRTGETFRGYIEYYDKRFIRLTRPKQPNLFLFKEDIKYLYEE